MRKERKKNSRKQRYIPIIKLATLVSLLFPDRSKEICLAVVSLMPRLGNGTTRNCDDAGVLIGARDAYLHSCAQHVRCIPLTHCPGFCRRNPRISYPAGAFLFKTKEVQIKRLDSLSSRTWYLLINWIPSCSLVEKSHKSGSPLSSS